MALSRSTGTVRSSSCRVRDHFLGKAGPDQVGLLQRTLRHDGARAGELALELAEATEVLGRVAAAAASSAASHRPKRPNR